MEARVEKAFDAINDLGKVNQIRISRAYFNLRINELRLRYEMQVKRRQIAEEQRLIREQMREEEKARPELEREQAEAAAEERNYERALEKARLEAQRATGDRMDELREKIHRLEEQVRQAHERGERAISRAQLTRSGYVYVISDVGSFGDQVVKIGMTRRLDPMDRVKELGDASVPFEFDVHAMVYSDDAPTLELEFHRRFADRRLNLINLRKEFFEVSLTEIQAVAKERGLVVEVTMAAEAREYRQTVARRLGLGKQTAAPAQPKFPNALPADYAVAL